jgi:hypothetical protein
MARILVQRICALPLCHMPPVSAPSPLEAAPPACLNCGHTLAPQRLNFCPACGQETNIKPPRVAEFLQQFGGAYFATEGALWRTLKLLLIKPGELTAQYLAGRRKHYVLPLRLYLSISVLVLLVVRLAAGDMNGAFKFDTDPRKNDMSIGVIGDHWQAGMKDGVFFCRGYPDWVCHRLQRRIDLDPQGVQRQSSELGRNALGNLGPALFVMLPIFALWLKLAYINRRLHYTEHLVFALHLHAFWFLALALTLVGNNWVTVLACISVPLYGMRAMRRVYGGRLWLRWLRAGTVSMLYLVTLLFVLVGVAIWTFLA